MKSSRSWRTMPRFTLERMACGTKSQAYMCTSTFLPWMRRTCKMGQTVMECRESCFLKQNNVSKRRVGLAALARVLEILVANDDPLVVTLARGPARNSWQKRRPSRCSHRVLTLARGASSQFQARMTTPSVFPACPGTRSRAGRARGILAAVGDDVWDGRRDDVSDEPCRRIVFQQTFHLKVSQGLKLKRGSKALSVQPFCSSEFCMTPVARTTQLSSGLLWAGFFLAPSTSPLVP